MSSYRYLICILQQPPLYIVFVQGDGRRKRPLQKSIEILEESLLKQRKINKKIQNETLRIILDLSGLFGLTTLSNYSKLKISQLVWLLNYIRR